MARRLPVLLLLAITLAVFPAGPAQARKSIKKAVWGPAFVGGGSDFPVYHDLGAGIYETNLDWDEVADQRPAHPRDPNDPAYHWDLRIDRAVTQARRYRMKVAILIGRSPPYANGGHDRTWAPHPKDFADFATAVARRYRSVHLWMIWGEPSRGPETFQPFQGARTARTYARLLDAAYGALKRVSRRNVVIGGMTYTTGGVDTPTWIRNLRLPSGRPPRLDMYGHNPFPYARSPNLADGPLQGRYFDFGGLRALARLVDRYLSPRRKLKLFLAEYAIPTDGSDAEYSYWVDRPVQAQWIRAALRITRRWSRIYTLGWIHLRDQPLENGGFLRSGLIGLDGRPKPGYFAFKNG